MSWGTGLSWASLTERSENATLHHAKKAFALRNNLRTRALCHCPRALYIHDLPLLHSPCTGHYLLRRARSQTHAEDVPEMAYVYFAYGKAFLENAAAQNLVLGRKRSRRTVREQCQFHGVLCLTDAPRACNEWHQQDLVVLG